MPWAQSIAKISHGTSGPFVLSWNSHEFRTRPELSPYPAVAPAGSKSTCSEAVF